MSPGPNKPFHLVDTETLTQTWKLTCVSGFLKDQPAATINIKTFEEFAVFNGKHNKIAACQANVTSSHL